MQARAVALRPRELTLDREWQGSRRVPFDYLVVATGTRLAPPGTVPADDKAPAVDYLKQYNRGIEEARSVLVVGGGAVGVQSTLASYSSTPPPLFFPFFSFLPPLPFLVTSTLQVGPFWTTC